MALQPHHFPIFASAPAAAPAAPEVVEHAAPQATQYVVRITYFLNRHAPRILAALIILYVVVFFAASVYKYETFGQGYDQVDFEQAIWNTVHGRPFADSRFSFTDSIFGLDWMPMLAIFVPFYALIPSPHTLFFLQILAGALGAVPVYLLARDIIGNKVAGLVFGALWLLYPTMEHGIMNPFQVRIFAVTALLFALLFFERKQLWPFLGAAAFAMLARTDVSLVVIMFGFYALLTRRRWPFVIAPLLLGGGYFLAVMTFVVPAFVHLPPVNCVRITDLDVLKSAWPGSNNPNLGYYLHWGCTPGEIVKNLVSDPLYTLNYMFGSWAKIGYLAGMLAPFAFLALLDPRGLILALPILGMNLIAWRSAQIDIEKQYSLLITVGVVAASIYGYKRLLDLITRLRDRQKSPPARANNEAGELGRTAALLMLALIICGIAVNILLHNPALRTVLYHEPATKVAAERALVALVPPEAHVAASSFLAPHLLPRQYIYNFPPAPYSPYSMDNFGPLEYILVDPDAQALDFNRLPNGKTALEELQASPEWTLLRQEQNLLLYKRR